MKGVRVADRIENLPKYLFAEIDKVKKEVAARGVDIISLGIGDNDLPTPAHIVDSLCRAAHNPANHRYPDYEGSRQFREAVCKWYLTRFGIGLNPATEVMALIGSKEGIAHLPMAFVNPGDVVLVPDPGYPVYGTMTSMTGGVPYRMPLLEKNFFLPVLEDIPPDMLARSRVMFLNYPNNPTGAVAPREFFERALRFAVKHGILLALDCAYSEIHYGKDVYRSIFDLPGAMDHCIEFHSLSKTYCMTGWRVGFAAGGERLIDAMLKVKTNLDSGVFTAVQEAAITALTSSQSCVDDLRNALKTRRDRTVEKLRKQGIRFAVPEGAFYIWAHVPGKATSADFCRDLLEGCGVVVTPGTGFGRYGEGYFRISLTTPDRRLDEALERMRKFVRTG
jgi:LL-diaminopimelate aminotransferase